MVHKPRPGIILEWDRIINALKYPADAPRTLNVMSKWRRMSLLEIDRYLKQLECELEEMKQRRDDGTNNRTSTGGT